MDVLPPVGLFNPPKGAPKGLPSTTDLALCVVIRLHALADPDDVATPSKADLQVLASAVLPMVKGMSSSLPRHKLYRRIKDALPAAAADWVVSSVEAFLASVEYPDDIATLFTSLQALLVPPAESPLDPPLVHPTSVFGQFLRRNLIMVNRALFSGLSKLFKQLKTLKPIAAADMVLAPSLLPSPTGGAGDAPPPVAPPTLPLHTELDSVDGLHRFFDLAVRRHADDLRRPPTAGQATPAARVTQYAALHLAAYHLVEHHLEAASAVLAETIRVAQQMGDARCVSYALALLAEVLGYEGDPVSQELLRRCRVRAQELGLWRLFALSHSAGEGAATDWLSFDPVASGGPEGPLSIPASEQSAVMGRHHVLRAQFWERRGQPQLSTAAAELQAVCHAATSSALTASASTVQVATNTARYFPAQWHAGVGTDVGFAAGLRMLIAAVGGGGVDAGVLLKEAALLWQEWQARRGATAMSLVPLRCSLTVSDAVRVGVSRAFALSRARRFGDAHTAFSGVMAQAKALQQRRMVVACLLGRGVLALEASADVATGAAAVPDVLHALSLCVNDETAALRLDCVVLLAALLLHVRRPSKALAVLHDHMPLVLENAAACTRAFACVLVAKCRLSNGDGAPDAHLKAALPWLQRARADWRAADDLQGVMDTAYLTARVHHGLGNVEDRELAAAEFMHCQGVWRQRVVGRPASTAVSFRVEHLGALQATLQAPA